MQDLTPLGLRHPDCRRLEDWTPARLYSLGADFLKRHESRHPLERGALLDRGSNVSVKQNTQPGWSGLLTRLRGLQWSNCCYLLKRRRTRPPMPMRPVDSSAREPGSGVCAIETPSSSANDGTLFGVPIAKKERTSLVLVAVK